MKIEFDIQMQSELRLEWLFHVRYAAVAVCLALVVKYITKRFIMEYDPYLGKTVVR